MLTRRPSLTKFRKAELVFRAVAGVSRWEERDEHYVQHAELQLTRPTVYAAISLVPQRRISTMALCCCPLESADALSAVYAFMRHADDLSDDPGMSSSERRQKLTEFMNLPSLARNRTH